MSYKLYNNALGYTIAIISAMLVYFSKALIKIQPYIFRNDTTFKVSKKKKI